MESNNLRALFIDFFKQKGHHFVPSSPIVVKNDPTLMFTNAGMNQFKDIFLGNKDAEHKRVVNSQKCLRVSGKHNDLEEVGHDTYHHTMFEMLGNWSFGDYFKKEAIAWAWEFLTDVLKIDKDRLYVTVFEGSSDEGLQPDYEAFEYWKNWVSEDRILFGSKKDNFWEMGDTGPCGPCSEIHIDLRNEQDRTKIPGKELVNKGSPEVIEIWNLVFIQFNRKADGSLEPLPNKHVDTGMGFERLAMVVQNKKSNYDTDIFQPLIKHISSLANVNYGEQHHSDVAMRVIADHIRAVSFAIADGQLPSNNGAGYVIRRILRRAIRYGYTYFNLNEPFIYKLVETLVNQMGNYYNELKEQKSLIEKVIFEEEQAFLRTLETGIRRFEQYLAKEQENLKQNPVISGTFAFELYDTYGFPIDLTQIIAREHNLSVDINTFEKCLQEQKDRSKKDAQVDTSDWIDIANNAEIEFCGYDELEMLTSIVKYRKIQQKGKTFYHIVLQKTPFYAESGGQVGDSGWIISQKTNKSIAVFNTFKENQLIIHLTDTLPENVNDTFIARVDVEKRKRTECNHSATHLLHEALRTVLGTHVEQRGSLVHPDYLRFDFSHPQKMTNEEITKVENIVNSKIWASIPLKEYRSMPIEQAKKMGAIALFGEKYNEEVRVIKFDTSVELCGGTHVKNTAHIGIFKILSESAISAGIRRIEAVTQNKAFEILNNSYNELKQARLLFNTNNLLKAIESQFSELKKLQKINELLINDKIQQLKDLLVNKIFEYNGLKIIAEQVNVVTTEMLKDLVYKLRNIDPSMMVMLYAVINEKPAIALSISDQLAQTHKWNASNLIKIIAKEIKGGGGGQPFIATAGGNDINGLKNLKKRLLELLNE